MTRNTRMIVGGVAAALVAVAAAQLLGNLITRDRVALTRFSSDEGRFAMMLPPGASTEEDTLQAEFGTLKVTTVRSRSKFIQFLVSYFDYPPDYMVRSKPADILAGAAQGVVSNLEGELLDERAFLHDGVATREVRAKTSRGLYMRCRVLLVDNRMYQLMALSTRSHIKDRKVADVFNSLDVIRKPEAKPAAVAASAPGRPDDSARAEPTDQ